MFDLFGAEMPLAVRFSVAFLIVLGLIGAAAWAVRRFRQQSDRRRDARTPAAARGHRLRQRRRAAPAHSRAARQRRASGDDRWTNQHSSRIQYRAGSSWYDSATSRRRGRAGAGSEILPRPIPLPEARQWLVAAATRTFESTIPAAPPRPGSRPIPDEPAPTPAPSLEEYRGRSAKRSPPSPKTSPRAPGAGGRFRRVPAQPTRGRPNRRIENSNRRAPKTGGG